MDPQRGTYFLGHSHPYLPSPARTLLTYVAPHRLINHPLHSQPTIPYRLCFQPLFTRFSPFRFGLQGVNFAPYTLYYYQPPHSPLLEHCTTTNGSNVTQRLSEFSSASFSTLTTQHEFPCISVHSLATKSFLGVASIKRVWN